MDFTPPISMQIQNGSFSIGDRVTVIDTNGTEHGVYTGVIEDIDDESDDALFCRLQFIIRQMILICH